MKFILPTVLLVMASLALPTPAHAQLSEPDILASQFTGDNRTLSGRLGLLAPLRGPTPPEGVALGYDDEKTVHTTRQGVGVLEDFHANGRFQGLRLRLGRSPALPLLVVDDRELDNAGVLDEKGTQGTTLTFAGHEEHPEVGLVWAVRGGTLTLNAARDAYAADGVSSVYQGTFGIFTQNPPFHFEKNTDFYSAALAVPIGRALAAELVAGREDAPGSLSLRNSEAEIQVPLGDDGSQVMGALRWHPLPRLTVAAYAGDGEYSGGGSVEREGGRAIGSGTSRRSEIGQGLGAQVRLRGGMLTVFEEYTRTRWNIAGDVPHPADLGLTVPVLGGGVLGDGTYHALYQISDQSLGLHWDRSYRADHLLSFGYRRVRLDPVLEADDTARVLFFLDSGQTQYTPGPKWGHLLQLRYRFPLWHLTCDLAASQAIPDISKSSTSSNSGGPSSGSGGDGSLPSAARVTSGGWSLSWTVEQRF